MSETKYEIMVFNEENKKALQKIITIEIFALRVKYNCNTNSALAAKLNTTSSSLNRVQNHPFNTLTVLPTVLSESSYKVGKIIVEKKMVKTIELMKLIG